MSIPGLGQDEPEEELSRVGGIPSEQIITHELRKETEWRFEVAIGRKIEVKVCFLPTRNTTTEGILGETILLTDLSPDHTRFGRTLRHRSRPEQNLHLHRDQSGHLHVDGMHDPSDV